MRSNVYKWIKIERKEFINIIDSEIFQALRGKRQLTGVHYVYPDANHTRFEHSIGVACVSEQFAQKLLPNDKKSQTVAFVAGLLHDIAHGTFSHSFDHSVYNKIHPGSEKGHDLQRFVFIEQQPLKALIEACGISTQDVANVWLGKYPILSSLFKGPLSPDRLDYIARDAKNTATKHFGGLDPHRIIDNCKVIDDKLQFNAKIFDDICHYLAGRYHMYQDVYLHRTSVAASIMVERMMDSVTRKGDRLNLLERCKKISTFAELSDDGLIDEVLRFKPTAFDFDMKRAQVYARKFKFRKLPKLVLEKQLTLKEKETLEKEFNELQTTNKHPDIDTFDKYVFREEILKIKNNNTDGFKNDSELISGEFDNVMVSFVWGSRSLDTIDWESFDKQDIYFFNNDVSNISFKDLLKKSKHYSQHLESENKFFIYRFYVENSTQRKHCQKLLALSKENKN